MGENLHKLVEKIFIWLHPPEKWEYGLADAINMHEMLTNQILLFHSSNTLVSVFCKTNTGAVLGLQIKQAMN